MLETLDLTRAVERDKYVTEVTRLQIMVRELGWQVYQQQVPVVIAFEGWDAAGKGGAIKRITEKLDPRGYVVYPISAPHGDDKTRHYLYRFWRRLPERGQIAIFDRSWYGRVLVERVEGFATASRVAAGIKEINSFERQLADFGAVVLKRSGSTLLGRSSCGGSRSVSRLGYKAVEADGRGLAQPGQVASVRGGGGGDDPANFDSDCAVDAGGRE